MPRRARSTASGAPSRPASSTICSRPAGKSTVSRYLYTSALVTMVSGYPAPERATARAAGRFLLPAGGRPSGRVRKESHMKYDEFVDAVAIRAGLSPAEAEVLTHAALQTLSDRLNAA